MKVDGTKLRLVLRIQQADDGELSAVIDSLDQNRTNLPVQTVKFDGKTLTLNIAYVRGTYVGILSKNPKELKGVWNERNDHELTFKRVAASITLPPPPPVGGEWRGTFNEAGVQKDVFLHLNTTSCTIIVSVLDVPGLGWNAIQVGKTTFQNGILALSMKSPHVIYSGKLNEVKGGFEGVWEDGQSTSLTLHRSLEPFRYYQRPQGCRGAPLPSLLNGVRKKHGIVDRGVWSL